ncbi:GNAT family N-acetyltransferase [Enterococcus sp. LJL128]|uniref:GNAT family N-acetyltransferase n=1 Tax=Enterococcus sp. LJL51 TaxID=3416656 RepID=UPI003CF7579D
MEIMETERLQLFEWSEDTLYGLQSFLQDAEVMYAYEHSFSDQEVRSWLEWNLSNYKELGYGLWGLKEKASGTIIGECGLTHQEIAGTSYLEIGYHLRKDFWHKGYAAEAAEYCKNYAFEKLRAPSVVSIIRDTNLSSMRVAIRNGMLPTERFVKHYQGIDMPHYLFEVKNNRI